MPRVSTAGGEDRNQDVYEPSLKRPRVAGACDDCRIKKIKCDGKQPVCSPCARRQGISAVCLWGVRKGRGPGVTKDDLEHLQRRINQLEDERSSETPRLSVVEKENNMSRAQKRMIDDDEDVYPGNAMLGLIDAEAQHISVDHEDSSAKSFAHQIRRVIDQQIAGDDVHGATPPTFTKNQLKRQWWNQQSRLQDYVLPPRHRADHLVDCYSRLVNTLYPFLDPTGFRSTYRRIWTGEDLEEDAPTFLCLLNIVFAIACNLDASISAADRVNEADVFYRRGYKFLKLDLMQDRSILTIQCFLILGLYLQSTNDSQQCWIFVGLAIRIAQSLGLDIPDTVGAHPTHKAEISRRVWYGCVVMDRTLSMTFGRSPMITLQAASMFSLQSTLSVHGTSYSSDGVSDTNEVSSDFFHETLKLYEIMAETLTDWYASPTRPLRPNGRLFTTDSGGAGARVIGKTLETDRKLWAWRRNLPLYLQRDETKRTKSLTHQRQSNVLWIRHHHVRLLLFRPLLARFCAIRDASPPSDERILYWKIILQCCITCVENALDTVSFLDEIMSQTPDRELDEILPAWWYTIFYLYSSATVLIAARLSPNILAHFLEDTIIRAWHNVLKMLTSLSAFSNHAKKCAETLAALYDQVSQQRPDDIQSHNQQQSEEQARLSMQSPQRGWRVDGTRNPQHFEPASQPTTAVDRQSYAIPYSPVLNDHSAAYPPRANGITFDHPSYQNVINFSSSLDLLDLPDIEIDLSQMSWLTSFPTEL